MRRDDTTSAVLANVLADHADVLEHLDAANEAAWATVDPALLDLCRRRVATLLGCPDTGTPPTADWPTSPAFDETQRACLAYTEQHVLDVAAMDDETVARLASALGNQGLVDFAHAVLVIEQRLRLQLIWESLIPEAVT